MEIVNTSSNVTFFSYFGSQMCFFVNLVLKNESVYNFDTFRYYNDNDTFRDQK